MAMSVTENKKAAPSNDGAAQGLFEGPEVSCGLTRIFGEAPLFRRGLFEENLLPREAQMDFRPD